jgi:hypothetical protein
MTVALSHHMFVAVTLNQKQEEKQANNLTHRRDANKKNNTIPPCTGYECMVQGNKEHTH